MCIIFIQGKILSDVVLCTAKLVYVVPEIKPRACMLGKHSQPSYLPKPLKPQHSTSRYDVVIQVPHRLRK